MVQVVFFPIPNCLNKTAVYSESQKILNEMLAFTGENTFRMELHTFNRMMPVT